MKLIKLILVLSVILGALMSCSDDDDGDGPTVVLRDPEEVRDENTVDIESFLETHFLNL